MQIPINPNPCPSWFDIRDRIDAALSTDLRTDPDAARRELNRAHYALVDAGETTAASYAERAVDALRAGQFGQARHFTHAAIREVMASGVRRTAALVPAGTGAAKVMRAAVEDAEALVRQSLDAADGRTTSNVGRGA